MFFVFGAASRCLQAGPAPAPSLVYPPNSAVNVDPDPTLRWNWIDDLVVNGSFESGMYPGWYTAGPNGSMWQIYITTTNQWATTIIPPSTTTSARLIQDVTIPWDATSATLQWRERIWNLTPAVRLGRFRVQLYKDGGAIANLEDASGSEPVFLAHTWVTRTTNLLAYAGSNLQIVIQADTYSPAAVNSWFADVDAFSFICQHSATPEFQIFIGKSKPLGWTDQVGSTTNLIFDSAVLDSSSTYYWTVASARDGFVTYSVTNRFTTGPRVLPRLSLAGMTDFSLRFQFLSRTNRYYLIEETSELGPAAYWAEATGFWPGSGGLIQLEVGRPFFGNAFWRLRVSP